MIPSVPEYSSITMARCVRLERMSAEHVERAARLRHEQRLAHKASPVLGRGLAVQRHGGHDREQILDVEHADRPRRANRAIDREGGCGHVRQRRGRPLRM